LQRLLELALGGIVAVEDERLLRLFEEGRAPAGIYRN
jgi:hypothetical protein